MARQPNFGLSVPTAHQPGNRARKRKRLSRRCPYRLAMSGRIWQGYTTQADAEAYASSLRAELLPGITQVTGYKGSYLLQRCCSEEIEFVTVMLWDSLEALREFAGPNYEQA